MSLLFLKKSTQKYNYSKLPLIIYIVVCTIVGIFVKDRFIHLYRSWCKEAAVFVGTVDVVDDLHIVHQYSIWCSVKLNEIYYRIFEIGSINKF